MAMNRINFTKKSIEALSLPEPGKLAYYFDSGGDAPAGFGMWVTGKGIKTFMVYRKINGRPERMMIGRYPDLTIEQARKQAQKLIGKIAEGLNPADAKRAARGQLGLGAIFDAYINEYAIPKKVKTIAAMRADFARYLGELKPNQKKKHGRERTKPQGSVNWQNRKPSSLTAMEIKRWHAALAKGSGPYAANRALQLLRAVINWGINAKLVDRKHLEDGENPAQGVELFQERSRTRFAHADELPRFFQAVADEPNETIRDFILIALLTGARKTNVLEMEWEQVNLERGTWHIPETKNGEAQTIPLTVEAIQILQARHDRKSDEFVFPGDGSAGHLASPKKGWARILARANIKDFRMHDLRRTMGSWQAATGASLPIIGKSLGHKDVNTTTIYARLNLDPVRDAMVKATTAMFAAGQPVVKPTTTKSVRARRA